MDFESWIIGTVILSLAVIGLWIGYEVISFLLSYWLIITMIAAVIMVLIYHEKASTVIKKSGKFIGELIQGVIEVMGAIFTALVSITKPIGNLMIWCWNKIT